MLFMQDMKIERKKLYETLYDRRFETYKDTKMENIMYICSL